MLKPAEAVARRGFVLDATFNKQTADNAARFAQFPETARRAGMSPQAMSELVGYLEQRDYVRRVPVPTDGRGRVVVYADRGTHAAEIATSFFADMEARWGALVGLDRLQDVKSALAEILGAPASHGAVTAKASAP